MIALSRAFGVTAFAICLSVSQPSSAAEIPATKNPEQMAAGCKAGGGVNLPLNSSGTFGCINKGGTIILCGGQTEQQKKSCTVARVVGKDGSALDQRMSATAKKR